MKCCETCGVNPRFRKINADAYQLKAEKLERKYKLNLEQARKANINLRIKIASEPQVKALRSKIASLKNVIRQLREKTC